MKRSFYLPEILDRVMRKSYPNMKINRTKIFPSIKNSIEDLTKNVFYNPVCVESTKQGVFAGIEVKVFIKKNQEGKKYVEFYAFSNDGGIQCLARLDQKQCSEERIKQLVSQFANNGIYHKEEEILFQR